MTTLDYVEIPTYATRLQARSPTTGTLKLEPKIVTSLPQPTPDSPTYANPPLLPNKLVLSNLPTLLLSSTLQLPSSPVANPRGGDVTLMSTRDPLSIPIMTVNFKRFMSNIGPVYWLQDRIEEVIMWKGGWKVTVIWMAAYAFLCCFPRLVLLLPHIILIGILLVTNPSRRNGPGNCSPGTPTPPSQVGEGSVDWQANLQATQNLLGIFSDIHDGIIPILPCLNNSSTYTPILFSFTLASFMALLPLVYLLPLRPTFLVIGLSPFFFTHPFTRSKLLPLFRSLVIRPCRKAFVLKLTRLIDDDKLEDKHWRAEVREVELWENERWNSNPKDKGVSPPAIGDNAEGSSSIMLSLGGWGKNNLKPGERKAWTRGRDGFSGISDNGSGDVSSNLTFSLESGWSFIETEDWGPDLAGSWIPAIGADDNGWVYTNDAWLDPRPIPLDEWISAGSGGGMTRRRRWLRRIYYAGVHDRPPVNAI